jgi:hypothetical protein
MRVVHLNGEVAMQLGEWTVLLVLYLQDVLQAARDKEKLLRQP